MSGLNEAGDRRAVFFFSYAQEGTHVTSEKNKFAAQSDLKCAKNERMPGPAAQPQEHPAFFRVQTLKRHKRQTATQRDKSALLYKTRYYL
jgi:hypothetical protein